MRELNYLETRLW